MRLFRSFIALIGLLAATPAVATTLTSGTLQTTNGSRLVCLVTNIGTTTLPIAALLTSSEGGGIAAGGTCVSGSIEPGRTCDMHTQAVGERSGYCQVVGPGSRFRASFLVVNASGVVTASLPVLK